MLGVFAVGDLLKHGRLRRLNFSPTRIVCSLHKFGRTRTSAFRTRMVVRFDEGVAGFGRESGYKKYM